MRVLVVNAGSSSLKLSVLGGGDEVVASESLPVRERGWDRGRLHEVLEGLEGVDAVGHRVVHGGDEFPGPVRVERGVVERLRVWGDLAPLHQPWALEGIEAVGRVLPGCPAVACFDTTFHAGLPEAASTYAVPERWRREWGVRRYGFHGLSHAYVSRRAVELVGGERVVSAHLGSGASLAAVSGGRCVDTTMGLTPLEGVVMSSRSGSVDPGMVLWLMRRAGLSVGEVARGLEQESGLVGLAGDGDMRRVLEREDAGAELALGVYVHRLRAAVAAMAAAMGGMDTLVFTGGVGEAAAPVRERVALGLGFLGVVVDVEANAVVEGEAEVSGVGARVRTLVVPSREDVEIAAGTRRVLGAV